MRTLNGEGTILFDPHEQKQKQNEFLGAVSQEVNSYRETNDSKEP